MEFMFGAVINYPTPSWWSCNATRLFDGAGLSVFQSCGRTGGRIIAVSKIKALAQAKVDSTVIPWSVTSVRGSAEDQA
jgi:hypothetical protein